MLFTNELLSSTSKDILPALQKSNVIYQFFRNTIVIANLNLIQFKTIQY